MQPNRAPRTTRPAAFVLRADVAVAVPSERSHEVERGRTERMNVLRRDKRLIGRQELRGAAAALQTDKGERAGRTASLNEQRTQSHKQMIAHVSCE